MIWCMRRMTVRVFGWCNTKVDPALEPAALGLGRPAALPAGLVQPCPKPRALIHKPMQDIVSSSHPETQRVQEFLLTLNGMSAWAVYRKISLSLLGKTYWNSMFSHSASLNTVCHLVALCNERTSQQSEHKLRAMSKCYINTVPFDVPHILKWCQILWPIGLPWDQWIANLKLFGWIDSDSCGFGIRAVGFRLDIPRFAHHFLSRAGVLDCTS